MRRENWDVVSQRSPRIFGKKNSVTARLGGGGVAGALVKAKGRGRRILLNFHIKHRLATEHDPEGRSGTRRKKKKELITRIYPV